MWKYHARLVRPGPISYRTSLKFLFSCPGTSWNKFTILYFIFGNYYELTYCVEKSVETDQLASSEASWSGSTLFLIVYVCFICFKVYTCILFTHRKAQIFVYYLFFIMGQVKLSMDKYLMALLLVPDLSLVSTGSTKEDLSLYNL